ncbi:MAG: Fimbrial assembly protein (PilN) [Firmicutes bacterium]|nr:Fimbrial assembly protein (PilN) [Bacillota bacterium]
MITINLLPLAERLPKWSFQRIVLLCGVTLFGLYGSIFAYNCYTIWSLEKDIEATHQQYSLLRPTQDNMQLAVSKQLAIDKKKKTLVAITGERKAGYAMISHFGIITPPQIWLTELAASDKNSILVKGNAMTYPDLANYLDSLENDKLVTEPVLIKAEQDSEFNYTKFEMTVKLKGI